MGHLTGLELAENMRSRYPALRVFILWHNDAFQQEAEQLEVDGYLDIKVTKTIDNGPAEEMSTTTNLMEIIIPYNMTGKSNITVYRNHNGSATAFRQLSTRPVSGAATDGTYYLDTTNHLIYVYTQKFSTYAIGYTVPSSGGGSSGSGGSSGGTVKSSKTADAGISLYAGMAVASLLGSGVVFSRKRKDF